MTTKITIPKDKVTAIEKASESLNEEIQSLKITDEASYDNACAMFSKVVAYKKRVNELKEEHTRPAANALRDARNKFKMLSEPYENMENVLRKALNVYVNEQERIAQEKAAKQLKEAEEAKKKATKSKKDDEPVVEVMPEPVEAPDMNRRTESGHVHSRTKKVLVIDDFSILSDDYKLPNEQKLKADLLDGKVIKGASLKEEKVIAVR